jgi:hypothetical protein
MDPGLHRVDASRDFLRDHQISIFKMKLPLSIFLFGKFGHLNLPFVSDFDIRISDFISVWA